MAESLGERLLLLLRDPYAAAQCLLPQGTTSKAFLLQMLVQGPLFQELILCPAPETILLGSQSQASRTGLSASCGHVWFAT